MAPPPPDPTLVDRLRAGGCVYAEEEAVLLDEAAAGPRDLEALVARRLAGEPLEQLVGWAELAGTRVAVAPGVFVPRRRTALMVALARARLAPGDVVVDLGCGTGAVAAAVGARVPGLEVYAVDVSAAAVEVARRNLPSATVLQGDLFEPLPDRLHHRVAAVLANLPYVPTAEIASMPREAREAEERVALDGGPDGTDVHRRAAAGVIEWLRPGGCVLVETGRRQAATTAGLLEEAGLTVRVEHDDDLAATVVCATR